MSWWQNRWQRVTRRWWERRALPASGLIDHGPQIRALTIREARIGAWADGRPAAYTVAEGIPARLSVTTLSQPSELLATIELPGAHGARGLGWAADGSLWIGSQPRGLVFSWTPGEPAARLIGRPTGDAEFSYGIAAADGGRMYLGTYPDACLVEHHPERGFRVLHRFEGAQYVRAVALDQPRGLLWAATSAPHRLWRFDLKAGGGAQPVELDPPLADCPDDLTITTTGVAFSAGHQLRLVDADTATERPLRGADGSPVASCWMGSRGLSPELAGTHWFTGRLDTAGSGQGLIGLDPVTGSLTPAGPTLTGPAIGWGTVAGRVQAVVGNYSGAGVEFNPDSGALARFELPVPAAPTRLHQLCATGQGAELLIGAYLNPAVVRVTPPASGEPWAPIGQVEAFCVVGPVVVVGSYPDGVVTSRLVADPSQQVHTLARFKASHGQARPWAFATSEADPGMVQVATAPGPGVRGGILARLPIDGSAGQLVRECPEPGHCVAALILTENQLVVGTSRYAGEGLAATPGRAWLFDLDPTTLRVRRGLPAPGRRAGAVTALVAHQQLVYGLADGRIFSLDPVRWQITAQRRLPGARAGVRDSGTLIVHPDGRLYALCGDRLFGVDPTTLKARQIAIPGGVGRMALDAEGTLWLLTRSESVMSRLASWQPDPTPTEGQPRL